MATQLHAVTDQFIVESAGSAHQAVVDLVANMYGGSADQVETLQEHKKFRYRNLDFYVQTMSHSAHIIFQTTKLNMVDHG